ncbi:MAG: hypothetical protein IIA09_05525 [Proteobacteria bacterium]|nr:hypothetical protein [Pseudomonadota bacterium]
MLFAEDVRHPAFLFWKVQCRIANTKRALHDVEEAVQIGPRNSFSHGEQRVDLRNNAIDGTDDLYR